ncbi:hypothetical protein [Halococcus salifodinae]|uniref:Uncharacterized protein n=1 Tax=Halococcus salifodinae DSM 8989 TaxID=1227456 RepID=M0NDE2_9EURY|nr:hypothetical protein [Halococcus salifodinae]EMA55563.1 hypothetical protein C450_02314 [Halococcus salifodinae DSM 8989]
MAILDTFVILAVSLLVGGLVIFTGVRFVVDDTVRPESALLTAAVGAVVWAAISFYAGRVPVVGPVTALVIWIVVIVLQYSSSWPTAAVLGFVAWFVSVVALYALGTLDIVSLSVLGVPEV